MMFKTRSHRILGMVLKEDSVIENAIGLEGLQKSSSTVQQTKQSTSELEENQTVNLLSMSNSSQPKLVLYSDSDSVEESESLYAKTRIENNPHQQNIDPNSSLSNEDFEWSDESWQPDYFDKETLSDMSLGTADADETLCVGKRGIRKRKPLPKRIRERQERCTGAGRCVKPNPCFGKKCGNQCSDNIDEETRQYIHAHYWGMASTQRQRDWLLSCVQTKEIRRKRVTSNSRRSISYGYSIPLQGREIKVCQQFLLRTLDLSQMTLRYAIAHAENIGFSKVDERGNHQPGNKTDPMKIENLKDFIMKLPAVPSHYCRNKSNEKLYLPQEFRNIPTLYKFYQKHLESSNQSSLAVSLAIFRKIFHKEFHLGFHLPKKDKCITCVRFTNLTQQELEEHNEEFGNHTRDKKQSKIMFLEDQQRSKEDPLYLCASFDLQKVLNTPHGDDITLGFSRKYAFYNESIYESGTRSAYCFLWGETDGKRGCNEICSIMYKYLQMIDNKQTYQVISLYCDSCAGQNRNRAMLSMIAFFTTRALFIKKVTITYLLPGHTMMPVDSIHSTIESFTKRRVIWAPSEWPTIISNSRTTPENYQTITMSIMDFRDWKSFSTVYLPSKFKIKIMTLRIAVFENDNPNIILKYGYFDDSATDQLNMRHVVRSRQNSAMISAEPPRVYSEKLKIGNAKYRDLKTLCEKGIIPNRYQVEYLGLQEDINIPDVLAESDEEDDTEVCADE